MYSVEWKVGVDVRFPSTPVWHPGEGRVYWSDVDEGCLYSLDAATGEAGEVFHDGRPIGAITVQADGSLLLFRDGGTIQRFSGGAVSDTVVPEISDFRKTRYACAAADPAGRVVCAVLSDRRHPVRFMLLDRAGRLSTIRETVGIPAAVAFGDGCAYFSNLHASRPEVLRLAYDAGAQNPVDGEVERVLDASAPMKRFSPSPAGMAALADGSLLVAMQGASEIVRRTAAGEAAESFRLQARRPIGLCVGGSGLDRLFVATAGCHRRPADGVHAGEMAVISGLPCPGAPQHLSRIGLGDDVELPAAATPAAQQPSPAVLDGSPEDPPDADPHPWQAAATQFVSC